MPAPISTRGVSSTPRFGAKPPSSPPIMTNAAPTMNTERGPMISESLPAVGCAMAHVRYSADISRVALPASIRKSCEIGASAVEISVLLTGLRPTPNIIAMMKVLGNAGVSLVLSAVFIAYRLPSAAIPWRRCVRSMWSQRRGPRARRHPMHIRWHAPAKLFG